jgi:hypothetical protein
METIHGAELVLLSFPEQNAGEYLGGLLTIATPMEKTGTGCVQKIMRTWTKCYYER